MAVDVVTCVLLERAISVCFLLDPPPLVSASVFFCGSDMWAHLVCVTVLIFLGLAPDFIASVSLFPIFIGLPNNHVFYTVLTHEFFYTIELRSNSLHPPDNHKSQDHRSTDHKKYFFSMKRQKDKLAARVYAYRFSASCARDQIS